MCQKAQENWVRLIYCLQDPTIHHTDLHTNVPVRQHILLHVYYNGVIIFNVMKIKKVSGKLTIALTFSMY